MLRCNQAHSSACREELTASGRRHPVANPLVLALAFALVFALTYSAPATAQEVTTQFWPEIDTFIRLGENSRLYIPLSRTREGLEDSNQDGTTGIYFDYYLLPFSKLPLIGPANAPRTRKLQLRAGYGFTAGGDGVPSTHTVQAELTWRRPLVWQFLLSDRNRFDLSFTGGEFDPRYRNRPPARAGHLRRGKGSDRLRLWRVLLLL